MGIIFIYYGSGNDYKYGLKIYLSEELKQHISIGEFSAGEEYIMKGEIVNLCKCKSIGLFNLLVKLNVTDKYIYIIYMFVYLREVNFG